MSGVWIDVEQDRRTTQVWIPNDALVILTPTRSAYSGSYNNCVLQVGSEKLHIDQDVRTVRSRIDKAREVSHGS